MPNLDTLYFEDYVGQDASDFQFVGIVGKEPEPIKDAPKQIGELERKYGDDLIRLYKYTAVSALGV